MKTRDKVWVALVTCGTLAEARKIAYAAVEKRLAACVNVARNPVESIYRWKGKIERTREYLLVIKTTAGNLRRLEKAVQESHSYEVPEFLVLPVEGGSEKYLKWVAESVEG